VQWLLHNVYCVRNVINKQATLLPLVQQAPSVIQWDVLVCLGVLATDLVVPCVFLGHMLVLVISPVELVSHAQLVCTILGGDRLVV